MSTPSVPSTKKLAQGSGDNIYKPNLKKKGKGDEK